MHVPKRTRHVHVVIAPNAQSRDHAIVDQHAMVPGLNRKPFVLPKRDLHLEVSLILSLTKVRYMPYQAHVKGASAEQLVDQV